MIEILIPNYKTMSRNKTITSHWRTYQKYRNEIAQLIRVYTPRFEPMTNTTIEIIAYFKGKRAIDTSNIDDKIIIDGLMKVGIIKDDTPEYNHTVIKICEPLTGKDELLIRVTGDVQ
jgi:Holliday junction resolvase RusA-like endonuclease